MLDPNEPAVAENRFILTENDPRFPVEDDTCWYWDTRRPLVKMDQPYFAVQCYRDRDPNMYVPVNGMRLLFIDQCEYYAVCPACYRAYSHMQWTGFTKCPDWRIESERFLLEHAKMKQWCEFCDPVFGNGGFI